MPFSGNDPKFLHFTTARGYNLCMPTAASILKETFGYDTFRPLQKEVIENVMSHRDTLAVMPTGGGKSLCYQIPALLLEGLTVVVSPLIALMKDQVEQLHAAGVPALFLNSSLSYEEYQQNMEYVRLGQVKLLYVAPETLLTPRLFSLLDSVPLDLLVIDEAHCISEWGHDFRPEYRQIVEVRRRYPKAVCLALTATATIRVRDDIKKSLGFTRSNEFVASFDRSNLYIEVAQKENPLKQTLNFLRRFKDQSGIIYCFSRKQVDELTADLVEKGYSARAYHAGLSDLERKRNQEAFIRDDAQIIVATIAFGMGINKPNVRFVLHHDLPKSIEGYYQEIGRAGRDGLPAHCLLLYSYGDVAKLNYFIEQKEGLERKVAMEHLNAMVRYAEDTVTCRRKPLLNYFGEENKVEKCGNCDNCTASAPVFTDITIPAQKFLSCVKRTGECFGAAHVADVLRGSRDEKVLSRSHDKLTTFGIGLEYSTQQWMALARQLEQMGLVRREKEHQTLSLTPKAMDMLRKRSPIMGSAIRADEKPRAAKERAPEPEYNHALYSLLRTKRKELADAEGVPPYVIFSDRTLLEMCIYYPQSKTSLLDINGVGKVKLEKYGVDFLQVICSYCSRHKLAEIPKPGKPEPVEKEKDPAKDPYLAGPRDKEVGRAFNSGQTVQQLVEQYHVTRGTILDHLTRYAMSGGPLRKEDGLASMTALSAYDRQLTMAAFQELGAQKLKPVFEKLDEKVTYDDLRIMRLLYLGEEKKAESN